MKKCLFLLVILFCPIYVFAEELIPNADSGILMEASTGKILFEKERDKEVSIASMTKMVAQILILEEIEAGHIKWSDVVTISRNASDMGGSQIYLEEGEEISVEDLMKGISVASGNDATVAMAEYISGSEEKFVQKMNEKVKQLGLKHTHFVNSTGLDEENHYSSAYDMAIVARELVLHHSDILRFSSIYEDYLRENTEKKFWLVNTNKLISQYEGTDGLKTGHTDNAKYCLAATAKRNSVRLIAIVLGEEDSKIRNQETMNLLDFGFSSIKATILKKRGELIQTIPLAMANHSSLPILLKEDLVVVEDINQKKSYAYRINLDDFIYPISKGDIVGKIDVMDGKRVVVSSPLISSLDIQKKSFLEVFYEEFIRFFNGIL